MNYGYAVMFTGLAVLAAVYVYDLVSASKLRRLVSVNLDNALVGGQFACNEDGLGYLYGLNAAAIAADMELYCEDASSYDRNELLPHVEAWMRKNGIVA